MKKQIVIEGDLGVIVEERKRGRGEEKPNIAASNRKPIRFSRSQA